MKITAKTILDAIVFLLMLLFIYAAVFKLLDFSSFKIYIGASPIGKSLAVTFALGIPLVELCVAYLLFTPRFRRIGLYASLLLMLGFTAYIGYYALFDIAQRPCACGGILNNMEWTEHLIFNIVFVLLAVVGIVLHINKTRNEYNAAVSY